IESLTKQYKAAIIVSEETLAPVRERFLYEALGTTTVKGRSQEVRIYRIIGIAPEAAVEKKAPWWQPRRQRVNKEALMFRITGPVDAEPLSAPGGGPQEAGGASSLLDER